MSRAWSLAALGAALLAAPSGIACAASASAEGIDSSTPPTESAAPQITAVYSVFNHGLHVVDATADYRLTDWGYGIRTTLHAGGLISWLLRMDITSTAEGRFAQGWVQPTEYESDGFSRGKHRKVVLQYREGTPHVVTLDPKESDREAVPSADLAHAMDTLSAMALLLESVRKTGKCDGHAEVFDGLRLSSMTAHGPSKSEVPRSFGQKFDGPALRCDFVGQQQAGFIEGSSHLATMKAPHSGAAWFQDLPGAGLTAVRVEFEHPKLGRMIAVLEQPPRITK
ncbi:DUF3108 domain-containing protein [Swaminathania salitolerans]|uniref:DUF3108 domain-containing protein n=1 Tax=Swaminathania salitolerans TaxID=182838 RepID=A0A511BNY0_9PROT|nr:DUF3108 domain-containing protein [Swaminathania salitolerans]GBQ15020.1 hypothetical protein AA21291_2033 [Swaminathania salitolerans LMG 21291]GEL01965.1 hypothetical protein SSA02_11280 [Swaminathania salitolerans]